MLDCENSLDSKAARKCWEKEFNDHYIQPILKRVDAKLSKAMDLITNDEIQGNCYS